MQTSPIQFEAIVAASRSAVWQAWTTPEGVESFFASQCTLELRIGGAYEMLFDLEAPPGSRGGEGCVILAIEPETMLSFTWNAPPEFPAIREQKTHVLVRLEAVDEGHTRVTLTQDGWGGNEDWQAVRKYFIRAWGEVVLPRLVQRFSVSPVQWESSDNREQK